MIGSRSAAMPLLEHLRELRRRLAISVGALVAGMVLSLPLAVRVMAGLEAMCPACDLQALQPTESIVTYFRVAMVLGLVIATPIILYQLVAFVSPGLHAHERRMLLLMLPGSAVLFAAGLAFGFWVALPRTISFLSMFMGDVASANWALGYYVSFVMNLLLVIGLTFQTPVVIFALAKLNIVSPAFLGHYRRHAIVIMAILAAVLTPTPDPFTMLIVLTPMIILFEVGILMARLARLGR